MSNDIPTPRTDAAAECLDVYDRHGQPYTMLESVSSQFARQLERELHEAKAEIERLKQLMRDTVDRSTEE